MQPFRPSIASTAGWVARRWAWLDRPRTLAHARLWVPLCLGLLALLYGQDMNWDLQNYHLYNPFALLNGKIGLDLAPAQWQSYFNPTLDLLYYGMVTHLPAPVAGLAMEVLHGVNFVLGLALAQRLLPPDAAGLAPRRLALLLALAGIAGAGFRSELGNSMGDNLTSLCVLGSLLMVMRAWPQTGRLGALALTGLLMGAGTGLKLTNATYALALCLSLLCLPCGLGRRVVAMFSFGIGVLAGIGITAGHWFWRMATVFGNPLFPQFNGYFQAPLAAPIGVGDTGWLAAAGRLRDATVAVHFHPPSAPRSSRPATARGSTPCWRRSGPLYVMLQAPAPASPRPSAAEQSRATAAAAAIIPAAQAVLGRYRLMLDAVPSLCHGGCWHCRAQRCVEPDGPGRRCHQKRRSRHRAPCAVA